MITTTQCRWYRKAKLTPKLKISWRLKASGFRLAAYQNTLEPGNSKAAENQENCRSFGDPVIQKTTETQKVKL